MLIQTNFDIQTHQPVYSVMNESYQCYMITTNILQAIKASQCTTQKQIQTLIQK